MNSYFFLIRIRVERITLDRIGSFLSYFKEMVN